MKKSLYYLIPLILFNTINIYIYIYIYILSLLCYILICRFMQKESQGHNDKGPAKTSLNKYVSLFICNVCVWEWVGNRTELRYIDPCSYGHQRCVFLVLLMFNRKPRVSAFCWVLAFSTTSCHQRVSQNTGGPFCWVVAFLTTSCLWLLWSPTHWLPVFTELYNSSIAHLIAHLIFGMACLIVIKRK